MSNRFFYAIYSLKPNFKVLPVKERSISAFGALIGIMLSSLMCWYALGGMNAWYIAPMGATSVLLFAVSSSPLAQPWNMIVGNLIAGLVGVSCTLLIQNLTLAFSIAVGLSIFLMMTTDSLHPPSGAVAITAVLGGDAVHRLGYYFVLYPVLLNSVLLLGLAIIFNRMVGRHYPQPAQVNQRSTDPTPTQKVTIQPADIEYALEQHTELLDISQYDLESIILEAQQHANHRLDIGQSCTEIMTKSVVFLNADDEIVYALARFKEMNIMSLPVLNTTHQLVGTLALSDVVEWFCNEAEMRGTWQNQVKHIMHRQVVMVKPEQNIADLIPYFVEKSFNYLPVVGDDRKMLGIISRSDMIAVLYQNLLQFK
ncbi:MAG: HPP family protein [Agitococcus sp.]|jgi:CBS domain-containing membrane protein|nr:HPP family protein [Moraxellaceae bacterium]MBK9184920.1 HPP family protein [Moraxellaceae bacterium]MBL0229780.1 HPP family protein [Moraxellaceae bacterium]MBP9216399.1 HPP family protein [Agitococcus sp.]HQV81303.1 HPP family protein [Agitococcus sp.]